MVLEQPRSLKRWWRARPGAWWWTASVIVVPVMVGTAVAIALLLAFVDVSEARDRIELLKTGFTIGAGAGGVAALVLAGRRQWSTERANKVTEQTAQNAHHIAERNAADSRHDATERRITELYTKAADQLGSNKAAVRLAGLYALERLAQDHENQRQTIVNLLCAYLRMPYQPPGDQPARDAPPAVHAEHSNRVQEGEVRLAAQRILTHHLRPNRLADDPASTFWKDLDIDLSNATLIDFRLDRCEVRHAEFQKATFIGQADFLGVGFSGRIGFGDVTFCGPALFNQARFSGNAGFSGAQFEGIARFVAAHFNRDAEFVTAHFRTKCAFTNARIDGDASFIAVRFDGPTWFNEAQFNGDAWFGSVEFSQRPVFEHVRFGRGIPEDIAELVANSGNSNEQSVEQDS